MSQTLPETLVGWKSLPRTGPYPGDDELPGILVIGVNPLSKKGDETHQVKLAAFCHNVLWMEGVRVMKSQRLACCAAALGWGSGNHGGRRQSLS